MNEPVDVLIIGAGASGAAVAWSLADTKMHILCLDQGGWMNPAEYPSTGRDWEARATPESIFTKLVGRAVAEGSVLLLHDADDYGAEGSWRRTAAALPRVLAELEGRGLEWTLNV